MQYVDLINYTNKVELLKGTVWDSRRFFILDEASKVVRKNDLIVAFFNKRIVFVYNLDLLQIRNGILIGRHDRYSIQENIGDIKLISTSLVWYSNTIQLCLVYS